MQGSIQHALSMPIKNPHVKLSVPPATQTDGYRFGHPEGVLEEIRFALNVSDKEIAEWIQSLPKELNQPTRFSAKVIAIALREYGWIITDNSDGAFFQFEYNVTAKEKWKDLGLHKQTIKRKKYPRDLLDGLITQEHSYALVPSEYIRFCISTKSRPFPR